MSNSNFAEVDTINPHQFFISGVYRIIDSEALFNDSDVVLIQHQGEQYRLRRTRNGKLILTK